MQLHERRRDDASEKIPSSNDIVSGNLARQSRAMPNSSLLDQLGSLPSQQMALSEKMQNRLNERFGTPMTGLKVFSDEGLSALGQTAYARGNEIHLDSMTPMSSSVGENTMMHEAAHIVQQGSGLASGTGILQNPALEADADRSADMSAQISAPPAFSMPTTAEGAPIQGKKKWHTEGYHEQGVGSSAPLLSINRRNRDKEALELLGNQRSAKALTSHSRLYGSKEHNGTLAPKSDTPTGSGGQPKDPAAIEAEIKKVLDEKREEKAKALEVAKEQELASLWKWLPGYEKRRQDVINEYQVKINKQNETDAQRNERLESEEKEKLSSFWRRNWLGRRLTGRKYAAKKAKRDIEKKLQAEKMGVERPESATTGAAQDDAMQPEAMQQGPAPVTTEQQEASLDEATQPEATQQEPAPAGNNEIHGKVTSDSKFDKGIGLAKAHKSTLIMAGGMGAKFIPSIDHAGKVISGEEMGKVDKWASRFIPSIGEDSTYKEVGDAGKVGQGLAATGNALNAAASGVNVVSSIGKGNVSKAGGNKQGKNESYLEATRYAVEAAESIVMTLADTGVLSSAAGAATAGVAEIIQGILKTGQGTTSAIQSKKIMNKMGEMHSSFDKENEEGEEGKDGEKSKVFSGEQQEMLKNTMKQAEGKAKIDRTQGIVTAVDGVISTAAGIAKLTGVGVAVGLLLTLLGAGVKAGAILAKLFAEAALIEETIDAEMGPQLTEMIDRLKEENPKLALRVDYDDFEQIAFKQLGFASGTREEVFQNIILNRVSSITAMANNLPDEMKTAKKSEKKDYAGLEGEARYKAKYKDWDTLDASTREAYRRRKFARKLSAGMGLSKVELSESDEGYEKDGKKKMGYAMQGMVEKLGMEKGVRWQEQLAAKRIDVDKFKRNQLMDLEKEAHTLKKKQEEPALFSFFDRIKKARINKQLAALDKKKALISGSKEEYDQERINYYKKKIVHLETKRKDISNVKPALLNSILTKLLDKKYEAKIAKVQKRLNLLTKTEVPEEGSPDSNIGRPTKISRKKEMFGKTALQKHQLELKYAAEDEKKKLEALHLEYAAAQKKEKESSAGSLAKWYHSKTVKSLEEDISNSIAALEAKQWLAYKFNDGDGNPETVKKIIALNAERQAKMESHWGVRGSIYNDKRRALTLKKFDSKYIELANSLRTTKPATKTKPENAPEQDQVGTSADTAINDTVDTPENAPEKEDQVDTSADTAVIDTVDTPENAPEKEDQVDTSADTAVIDTVDTPENAPEKEDQVDTSADTAVIDTVDTPENAPEKDSDVVPENTEASEKENPVDMPKSDTQPMAPNVGRDQLTRAKETQPHPVTPELLQEAIEKIRAKKFK